MTEQSWEQIPSSSQPTDDWDQAGVLTVWWVLRQKSSAKPLLNSWPTETESNKYCLGWYVLKQDSKCSSQSHPSEHVSPGDSPSERPTTCSDTGCSRRSYTAVLCQGSNMCSWGTLSETNWPRPCMKTPVFLMCLMVRLCTQDGI